MRTCRQEPGHCSDRTGMILGAEGAGRTGPPPRQMAREREREYPKFRAGELRAVPPLNHVWLCSARPLRR